MKAAGSVLLKFDSQHGVADRSQAPSTDLSAIVQAHGELWVASDESAHVERLSRGRKNIYDSHATFPLADYLELPLGANAEVDIEGMDYEHNYLWIVGSHSLKRGKVVAGSKHPKRAMRELAGVERGGNRYLLARIPLIAAGDGTPHRLLARCPDPTDPAQTLSAAQLMGGDRGNLLTDALRDDALLAPFLSIPDKENGFNIEGLAALGQRLFLGLRGPVVGGWAVILEIEIEPAGPSFLRLKPIGRKGRQYKKHLLDLKGLGVRELCRDGSDLLILAGPTMQLGGDAVVLRWKDVAEVGRESLVTRDELEKVLDLPYGIGGREDTDHPEGITMFAAEGQSRAALVVYDSPRKSRTLGRNGVRADLFEIQ